MAKHSRLQCEPHTIHNEQRSVKRWITWIWRNCFNDIVSNSDSEICTDITLMCVPHARILFVCSEFWIILNSISFFFRSSFLTFLNSFTSNHSAIVVIRCFKRNSKTYPNQTIQCHRIHETSKCFISTVSISVPSVFGET